MKGPWHRSPYALGHTLPSWLCRRRESGPTPGFPLCVSGCGGQVHNAAEQLREHLLGRGLCHHHEAESLALCLPACPVYGPSLPA